MFFCNHTNIEQFDRKGSLEVINSTSLRGLMKSYCSGLCILLSWTPLRMKAHRLPGQPIPVFDHNYGRRKYTYVNQNLPCSSSCLLLLIPSLHTSKKSLSHFLHTFQYREQQSLLWVFSSRKYCFYQGVCDYLFLGVKAWILYSIYSLSSIAILHYFKRH